MVVLPRTDELSKDLKKRERWKYSAGQETSLPIIPASASLFFPSLFKVKRRFVTGVQSHECFWWRKERETVSREGRRTRRGHRIKVIEKNQRRDEETFFKEGFACDLECAAWKADESKLNRNSKKKGLNKHLKGKELQGSVDGISESDYLLCQRAGADTKDWTTPTSLSAVSLMILGIAQKYEIKVRLSLISLHGSCGWMIHSLPDVPEHGSAVHADWHCCGNFHRWLCNH